MMIKPGEFGDFKVQVVTAAAFLRNGQLHAHAFEPSNQSRRHLRLNRNTDFDCTGGGVSYRGIHMTASQMIASRRWNAAGRSR